MKKIITVLMLVISVNYSSAQNINWQSINKDQKSITYLNFGYNFGMITQIGYGYKSDAFRPIVLTADYSFPMGENLFDDFKIRLGGQISIFEKRNFILSAKIYGIFRRHQTSLVRMASFGSELSAIAGYYKPTWYIAGEFGFDKSIITHLKHSNIMLDNSPLITDGWFISSGGNFFYGVQGSKTLGKSLEISLRVGATNAQFKDENSLLPFYALLGIVWKFYSKKEIE